MSLKELLPPGTWEELHTGGEAPPEPQTELPQPSPGSGAGPAPQGLMVHCPVCGVLCRYDSSNPCRPFCSERCRLLDLYAWAAEERRIPGECTGTAAVTGTPAETETETEPDRGSRQS